MSGIWVDSAVPPPAPVQPRGTGVAASALSRYFVDSEAPFGAVSRRGCSFCEVGTASALIFPAEAVMGVKKCSPSRNHQHPYPQPEQDGPPRTNWIVPRQSTVGRKRSQPCLASSCFWHFPPRHKLRQSALMRKSSAIASLSRTPAYR